MTDADVIHAIRYRHLKANIAFFEDDPRQSVVHWDRATVDPGSALFGNGPYLKVPVSEDYEEIVIRVYAPAKLRRRLRSRWARPDTETP